MKTNPINVPITISKLKNGFSCRISFEFILTSCKKPIECLVTSSRLFLSPLSSSKSKLVRLFRFLSFLKNPQFSASSSDIHSTFFLSRHNHFFIHKKTIFAIFKKIFNNSIFQRMKRNYRNKTSVAELLNQKRNGLLKHLQLLIHHKTKGHKILRGWMKTFFLPPINSFN